MFVSLGCRKERNETQMPETGINRKRKENLRLFMTVNYFRLLPGIPLWYSNQCTTHSLRSLCSLNKIKYILLSHFPVKVIWWLCFRKAIFWLCFYWDLISSSLSRSVITGEYAPLPQDFDRPNISKTYLTIVQRAGISFEQIRCAPELITAHTKR